MIILEIICLAESLVHLTLKFRTAVILKGPAYSYKFRDILKAYWQSGLLFDVFGLSPFNIVFSLARVNDPYYVVVPLKLLRLMIVFNVFEVIAHIQELNYKISSTIYTCATFCGFIFLIHFVSTAWYFVNSVVEKSVPLTWEKHNKLVDAPFSRKISLSIYYLTKIVAGVGSGDSFAATNLERIVTCVIVHIGDILFALVFGIITALAASWSYETDAYLSQKLHLEKFAATFSLTEGNKKQVKEYKEYVKSVRYNEKVSEEAREVLPVMLAKEVVYETYKELLEELFREVKCMNFVRKLTRRIETERYLPGDFVVQKGDIGGEVYLILDGKVEVFDSTRRNVLYKLKSGAYFGETGLFFKCKREYYVQAKTHCTICLLKCAAMQEVAKKFPAVEKKLSEHANKLYEELQERNKRFIYEELEESPINRKQLDLTEEDKEAFDAGLSFISKEPELAQEDIVSDILEREIELRMHEREEKLKGDMSRVARSKGRRLSQATLGEYLRLSERAEAKLKLSVIKQSDTHKDQ